jgi:hypothetical protein
VLRISSRCLPFRETGGLYLLCRIANFEIFKILLLAVEQASIRDILQYAQAARALVSDLESGMALRVRPHPCRYDMSIRHDCMLGYAVLTRVCCSQTTACYHFCWSTVTEVSPWSLGMCSGNARTYCRRTAFQPAPAGSTCEVPSQRLGYRVAGQ